MHNKLGIAIDIGTTTVALRLIDIETGEKLCETGATNAQAPFGADVTSRIVYCAENGHEKLTELIRGQLDALSKDLLREAGAEEQCAAVTIAGNTVMQHIAAGYSPVSLGTAPFTPISLFGTQLPPWETLPFVPHAKDANIYYAPCISSYVGGDITAGLLAAGFEDIKDTALLIDIGTNGEIALKHKGVYYCCATAAGPAFEKLESVNLRGSELIEMLAEMIDAGIIDKTGRLTYEDDRISAADIRKLQLAKAAIAAGIQVLMHYAGISESDIKAVALAGAFGTAMNPASAVQIGLFPKKLLPVAKGYGNTALDGAAMALMSETFRTQMEKIRKKCEYIELSSIALFNDKFVENINF